MDSLEHECRARKGERLNSRKRVFADNSEISVTKIPDKPLKSRNNRHRVTTTEPIPPNKRYQKIFRWMQLANLLGRPVLSGFEAAAEKRETEHYEPHATALESNIIFPADPGPERLYSHLPATLADLLELREGSAAHFSDRTKAELTHTIAQRVARAVHAWASQRLAFSVYRNVEGDGFYVLRENHQRRLRTEAFQPIAGFFAALDGCEMERIRSCAYCGNIFYATRTTHRGNNVVGCSPTCNRNLRAGRHRQKLRAEAKKAAAASRRLRVIRPHMGRIG